MSERAGEPEPFPWRGRWGWRSDVTAVVLFLAVVVLSHEFLFMARVSGSYLGDTAYFVLAGAAAIGCARVLPGVALTLIWVGTLLQMLSGFDVDMSQLAVLYVVGMVARYGNRLWVFMAGLSIAVGSVLGTFYIARVGSWVSVPLFAAMESNAWPVNNQLIAIFVVVTAVMTLPWLLGLLVRLFAGKQTAERGSAQAREEADNALELVRLRTENAALARDVHDVVGHSLAVIIAQADSIRFIPDTDVLRIRETTGTIADAARRSLGEVRQVLSQTAEAPPAARLAASFSAPPTAQSTALQTAQLGLVLPDASQLSAILHNVRGAGYAVSEETLGDPVPLPAELVPATRRIIQEMLANALHHGCPSTPIYVQHYWGATSYTLSVTNYFDAAQDTGRSGTGIVGMRQRLASLTGTLSIDTEDGTAGAPDRFTIAATFPITTEWMRS
ncbi:histidine kinase [Paeniglutamicibacter gangotriensis]|uniref:histidine kinase n=2 Tax=Paeniglutamicibacter gangotriensis TaxID=254787 RepID=M7MXP5_9MICC|nr:histidine kinase [Paeniglutamicibacter gangotriensis]EMQ99730.1 two-component sensor histidine kinase [Paeniglutamicibacter gangotriensis Lz1y]KAA0978734.1 two-component sensor histidine kinase [Paeniglutamicibacter gangotriensis]